MRKSKIEKALENLKGRGEAALGTGRRIIMELGKYTAGGRLPGSRDAGERLGETLDRIEERGLPSLQKELGEALVSAARVLDAMDESRDALGKVLELVNYRYGTGVETVFEYFTPPNRRAFGQTSDKRLLAHSRLAEAFERHSEDFREDDAQRFTRAAAAGRDLEAAHLEFIGRRERAPTPSPR